MIKLLCSHFINFVLLVLYKIKHTSFYVMLRQKLFLVSALSVFLLQSCVKDDLDLDKLETTNWNPSVAVPLAYASMSMADLLKKDETSGNLVIDSDKFCTLIYTGRAIEIKADALITIPNQTVTQTVQLDDAAATAINTLGSVTFSYSQNFDFGMSNGIELDSITLKNGQLKLDLESGIPANTVLEIKIPAATLNGIAFRQTVLLNYTGTLPITVVAIPDLDGYKVDMTNGGVTNNQVKIFYTLSITTTGTPVQNTNKVLSKMTFRNIAYQNVFGYFGQMNLLSPLDTIVINLFNTGQGLGTFVIKDPEIRIDLVNSLGLPVRASVNNMTGMNADLTSLVVATGIPDPLPIFHPGLNEVGQSKTGSFTMNNANSNVSAMIANHPKFVISQITSTTNPDGNVSGNFVTDSSLFAVDMNVKLPLYGSAKDFLLKDTVNFNYNNFNNVTELMIRTSLTNGFPLDVNFQILFADDNYTILDSLVTSNQLIMPSGIVDAATGRVISPVTQTTDHTLNHTRVLNIASARKLILKASAATINNGNTDIKIYSDYKFDVNIGAIAKITL